MTATDRETANLIMEKVSVGLILMKNDMRSADCGDEQESPARG